MKLIAVNLNDGVRVTLKSGKVLRMQIWTMMQEYGNHIGFGSTPFASNTIYIEQDDPIPPSKRMTKEEQDLHNANTLGLTMAELDRYYGLMNNPMRDWPDELTGYVNGALSGKPICGDLMAETVANWIKGKRK